MKLATAEELIFQDFDHLTKRENMKLTTTQLRKIIAEEVKKSVMEEASSNVNASIDKAISIAMTLSKRFMSPDSVRLAGDELLGILQNLKSQISQEQI